MVVSLQRRQLLRGASIAVLAPALLLPRRGQAAARTEVRAIEPGKLGVTLELGLEHGPYPHAGSRWQDDTCIAFVPAHFRCPDTAKIDTLVHFHGHGTNARKTIAEKQLKQQFHRSKQNAIMVVPQGPVDAKDGDFGKLEEDRGFLRFLGEVRRALQLPEVGEALGASALAENARIGATAISAHSGGYRAAASVLARGGWDINEVYLFDALYGAREDFLRWVLERRDQTGMRERHKLVAWYGVDAVTAQCRKLRDELDEEGLAYRHETDGRKVARAEMVRARVIFVRADAPHREVMHKTDGLSRCLGWSCFSRAPGT